MPDKIHSDPDIAFNSATNTVEFKGEAGQGLLYAYLIKGKFGEAFDSNMLFNERLARILAVLSGNLASLRPTETEGPFSARDIQTMANRLLWHADDVGWWRKTRQEQVDFLRCVVAVPHPLSDEQVEWFFDAIDAELLHSEALLAAARAWRSRFPVGK